MKTPIPQQTPSGGSMRRLVRGWLRWPQDAAHPVRRYWSPWYVIAWRSIWIIPAWVLRIALVAVVAAGWGKRSAEILWNDLQ